ncbi:MAG: apolipoprotein N-acyltransferase [Planctomycetota bacterium]|nr:MAG: apolipoprotein N-acyltransferase [Planctomycetota bacterium]
MMAKKRGKSEAGMEVSPPEHRPSERRPEGFAPWASAAMYWAAQAPLRWSVLGAVAPIGWIHLAAVDRPLRGRDYLNLWLSGCALWLATLQGIRLAFWPLYAGWIVLSLYLAVYVPVFVLASRTMRRWKIPLLGAVPIAWMGGDWIRSYAFTGYSANMLVHAWAEHPMWIQLADQIGAMGVSGLMAMVATGIYLTGRAMVSGTWKKAILPATTSMIVLLVVAGYGRFRLQQADRLYAARDPLLRSVLIQENTPTMFEADLDRLQRAWTAYLNQTRTASRYAPVDLVVWPESTFSAGSAWLASAEIPERLPEELQQAKVDRQTLGEWVSRSQQDFEFKARLVLAAARGEDAYDLAPEEPPNWPRLVVGADAMEIDAQGVRRYNAALLIDPSARVVGRYNKMHLVMFGEYIPLEPILGWLGRMFGFSGIDAGRQPECFDIGTVHIAPNICFESTMPRLVRRQIAELKRRGHAADCLINLTNDSWFRGSSILDHHLACTIVTAVENRRPTLVAANTGLSAEIDGCGRVVQRLDRFQSGAILAQPRPDARSGLVQQVGYPLSVLCGVATILSLLQAAVVRFGSTRLSPWLGRSQR